MDANRSYFGLQKHLKSKLLSRSTKTQLYKTLIRPVIIYGSECWTLSQLDQQMMDGFERKVLRKIYGPVQGKGTRRSTHNDELYTLFKESKLTTAIRLARLRCAGHVQLMGDTKPRGKRQVGRPRARWLDEVNSVAREIGIRRRWTRALDKGEWRRPLREAKTLKEL
jgi:hypothetical protein